MIKEFWKNKKLWQKILIILLVLLILWVLFVLIVYLLLYFGVIDGKVLLPVHKPI